MCGVKVAISGFFFVPNRADSGFSKNESGDRHAPHPFLHPSLHLAVQADFANDALTFRCRNAGNFGPTAYRLPGGSITRPLLDGIGLVLLGRSDTMPKELQRIPYQRIN